MKKAFTLIELLIVIAIIGILATIVITYALPAIGKARDAGVLAQMNDAQKTAASCLVSGGNVNLTLGAAPSGSICDDTSIPGSWPDLTTKPIKSSGGADWGLLPVSSAPTGSAFLFVADDSTATVSATVTITCKQSGCTKTGF